MLRMHPNNFSFQHHMPCLVPKCSAWQSGSFGAYRVKICCVVFVLHMHNSLWHTFIRVEYTALLIIYFRVHSQRKRSLVNSSKFTHFHLSSELEDGKIMLYCINYIIDDVMW